MLEPAQIEEPNGSGTNEVKDSCEEVWIYEMQTL